MLRNISLLAVIVCFVAGCSGSGPAPVAQGPAATPATPGAPINSQAPLSNGAAANVDPSLSSDTPAFPADGDNSLPGNPSDGSAAPGEASVDELMDLMDQAKGKLQTGDTDGCVALLKQVLAQDAAHRDALAALASQVQRQAQIKVQAGDAPAAYPLFIESAGYFRQLRDAYPDLTEGEQQLAPDILYNEACALAMGDKPQPALAALEEALEAGYSDFANLDRDTDLASVRALPEFATMKEKQASQAGERARAHAQEELAHGESYAFDFSLPDLNEKTVSLADYKGKVLIVDFWGTWCPPCRMEIPHFVALHDKYHEQGFEIVGLNYEGGAPAEDKQTILDFVAENKINYTCLPGDEATQSQVPGFRGYPTTLFIDRTGKVRLTVVGYHPLEQLDALVSELLAEPVPEEASSGG